MITIAFIDHHLNNFHANTFLKLLRGLPSGEEVEIVAWESDPTGDDWCAKNQVRRADSPEEAVAAAEGVILLAPDNIDAHPALAARVLPGGKPTLIDKMLAPTLSEAQQIVEIARRHNTPLFSSSSLRYAVELEALLPELQGGPINELFVRGMGAWSGYGVHSVAMALRIMGMDIRRLIDTGTPLAHTVTLDYGEGRRAVIDVRHAANEWEQFPWSFAARVGDRYVGATVVAFDGFYKNLMGQAVAFFRTGKGDMPIEEALTTVAVVESAQRSQAAGGAWMPFSAA